MEKGKTSTKTTTTTTTKTHVAEFPFLRHWVLQVLRRTSALGKLLDPISWAAAS